MTDHGTPQDAAPHGADDPGSGHGPAAGGESTAASTGGEGLRRWLPRRRVTPAASATGDTTPAPDVAAEPAEPPPVADAPAEAPTAGADAADAPAAAEAEPSADAEAAPAKPRRRWGRRRATPTAPAADETGTAPDADQPSAAPVAADAETNPARLRRRRKRLISDRELAVYHLGGLAFELYRRDLLTEEVLRRRAGAVSLIDETVHDIDERLAQLDSERREKRARRGEPGITTAGNCLACRAPFQAEARFCWQCGAQLNAAPDLDAQVTQTISAQSP
jgi:hypothetical protein